METPTTNCKKCVIGIDPGKNGGLSVFTIVSNKVKHKGSIRIPYGPRELYEWLAIHGLGAQFGLWETVIYIEDVHSMPRDGHQAAFTFGWHVGFLYGILGMFPSAVIIKVSPQKWQKSYDIKKDKGESSYQWKKRLIILARETLSAPKLDRATADAALIAFYGTKMEALNGTCNIASDSRSRVSRT